MERHCVMEHLALDRITGKDPEGIRIRPAQGFEAADYFMGNFWVRFTDIYVLHFGFPPISYSYTNRIQ
jgi:hypothetical protein